MLACRGWVVWARCRTLDGLSSPHWLDRSELRIGLGCMRLPADSGLAGETIAAAVGAGVTVFDTAHAYGQGERDLGRAERLLAGVLSRSAADRGARIVTKGGMTRAGDGWVPDGRAKAILGDCEASLIALGGLPIDLFLIHAPDPRTPWRTSVRALARLADEGLVRRVGLSNVNRTQLDEALELAPVSAVEVALSVFDPRALRGGIVARCAELGIALIAHSPLGGPRRAAVVARNQHLLAIAGAHGVGPAQVALAWLLGLSDVVVAIPGARRPQTALDSARAATLSLTSAEQALLDRAFGTEPAPRRTPVSDGEVVVVMGIPGAGKTRLAEDYVGRGYLRLNRDERGGSLRGLAVALDESLSSGTRRIVLDNTFLGRATRSYVIEAAGRHRVPATCVWLNTPLAQAQVNLIGRLIALFGSLPDPDELRELSRREPGVMTPTSQMRSLRELEPPSLDEGFARVEEVPFERAVPEDSGASGVFVAAAALRTPGWEAAVQRAAPGTPHLVFDWTPGADLDTLAGLIAGLSEVVSGPVQAAICPHGGGPPSCWCRPPLPGLPLAFARARGLEPAASIVIGARPADRNLAAALGAGYVGV
jgi:aryl-alcohol dehydrogenase-like predicted oxidoreductase